MSNPWIKVFYYQRIIEKDIESTITALLTKHHLKLVFCADLQVLKC